MKFFSILQWGDITSTDNMLEFILNYKGFIGFGINGKFGYYLIIAIAIIIAILAVIGLITTIAAVIKLKRKTKSRKIKF